MGILSRYFLASYLRFFVLVLSVSLIAVVVVEMLVNFDEIVEHREATGGPLAYLLIRVPALYLREMIPAASFAASFLCVGLPTLRHEITAMKTGGIAPQHISLPVLLAATLLSGATLLLNETFLLGATREFTRLEYPEESIVFGRNSFWYHRGDTFYNVRSRDPETGTLHGVRIFTLNQQGRLVESIRAQEVTIADGNRWTARDATRQRFDPSAPAVLPQVDQVPEVLVDLGGRDSLELLEASENTLSVPQLLETIEARRQEQRDASRYSAMLHARLATPLTVLLFALLAIPVGLSVERTRNVAVSALLGISVVGAFYAVWHVSTLVGRSGFAFAAPSPWLVLVGFAGGGAWWLLRRSPR